MSAWSQRELCADAVAEGGPSFVSIVHHYAAATGESQVSKPVPTSTHVDPNTSANRLAREAIAP
jgi:hypothetical protein